MSGVCGFQCFSWISNLFQPQTKGVGGLNLFPVFSIGSCQCGIGFRLMLLLLPMENIPAILDLAHRFYAFLSRDADGRRVALSADALYEFCHGCSPCSLFLSLSFFPPSFRLHVSLTSFLSLFE